MWKHGVNRHVYGVLRQCLNLYSSPSEEEDVIGRGSLVKILSFRDPHLENTWFALSYRYIATKKSSEGLAKCRENG